MGIIRAIGQAIGGTLADQWLEVIEADDMSDKTVFTSGVLIRKGQNTKGTGNTVSNGSKQIIRLITAFFDRGNSHRF